MESNMETQLLTAKTPQSARPTPMPVASPTATPLWKRAICAVGAIAAVGTLIAAYARVPGMNTIVHNAPLPDDLAGRLSYLETKLSRLETAIDSIYNQTKTNSFKTDYLLVKSLNVYNSGVLLFNPKKPFFNASVVLNGTTDDFQMFLEGEILVNQEYYVDYLQKNEQANNGTPTEKEKMTALMEKLKSHESSKSENMKKKAL